MQAIFFLENATQKSNEQYKGKPSLATLLNQLDVIIGPSKSQDIKEQQEMTKMALLDFFCYCVPLLRNLKNFTEFFERDQKT